MIIMTGSINQNLEEFRKYKPMLTKEKDFDDFWKKTLNERNNFALDIHMEQLDYPVKGIKAYDLSYRGCNGQKIKAWYVIPENCDLQKKVPAIVHFSGYTWGRGYVSQFLMWALQGYAVISIDIRGQGGATPDNTVYSQGSFTGWFTKGILDKSEYYYKGVFIDGIRALDFLETRDEIDTSRIGVVGGSQGGAIALAVAGLDNRPAYAMTSFPFLCNLKKAFEIAENHPYMELTEYFKLFDPEMKTSDRVFETLSYFDIMNHASNIKCPVLMAVTLKDVICPPETVFAAYNHITSPKECVVYPLHGHEALFSHSEHMLKFAAEHSFGQVR